MWTPFASVVAGSAAGLTGLTFIVVAFRYDVIAVSAELRNRAAQALVLFVTVTVTGAVVTAPQPAPALFLELFLAGVLVGALLLRLDRAARAVVDRPPRRVLVAAQVAFAGLLCAAGALGLAGLPALHVWAAATLVGLGWGVLGAWTFLTGVDRQDRPDGGPVLDG